MSKALRGFILGLFSFFLYMFVGLRRIGRL